MSEQRLKITEGFVRDVLDGIEEGLVVIDKDYKIVLSNAKFAEQVNLRGEELLGKKCFQCANHKDRPCYEDGEKCPTKRTFETGSASAAIHTHTDSAGNSIFLEVKSFPLRDSSGEVISSIEITRDITEQWRTDSQFCSSLKMDAIGTMIGGIAHDFNNLLNIIIGYCEIMRGDIFEKSETKTRLDAILMAAYRGTNITKGLLALSGQQSIKAKPVNVNDIVTGVRQSLSEILGKGIELRTNLAAEDIVIQADIVRFEQILTNLAMNARDAMPRGGIFSVSTELVRVDPESAVTKGLAQSDRYLIVTISDTGMGMDERTKKRIFEPYFTTKEMDKGRGLGLFMVYEIIRRHNGFIEVSSRLEEGTTFKIYLPVIKSEPAKKGIEPISKPRGGTGIILLVEDDGAARRVTKYLLEELGYYVIQAVDGEDAMKKFRANKDRIQGVLLDVVMPEGSIKPVYDKMCLIRPDIKAIFLSGYTEDFLKESGMIGEGLHFLTKPVQPAKLASKIREVFDS